MQKLKQSEACGIGYNLKRMREGKRLTQVDMEREFDFYGMNVSRVTYNKMEHNKYSIRIQELLVLKQIFECDFDDFFKGLDMPRRQI